MATWMCKGTLWRECYLLALQHVVLRLLHGRPNQAQFVCHSPGLCDLLRRPLRRPPARVKEHELRQNTTAGKISDNCTWMPSLRNLCPP